jgi:hypothetical protein
VRRKTGFAGTFVTGFTKKIYWHNVKTPLKKRPLSRLHRQLPLRREANEVRRKFISRSRCAKRYGFRKYFDTGFTQYLHRTIVKRQFHGFIGIFDTGLTQYMYS